MRTLAALLCIAIVAAGLVAPPASAQAAKLADRLVVPLAGTVAGGGTFAGSFSITRFETRVDAAGVTGIYAVGMVSGVVSGPADLARSGISGPLALPVTVTRDQPSATRGAIVAQQEPVPCEIHLSFGGLDLNFLGLVVTLSPITIDLVAGPGPVGNIVSQICALLNTVGDVLGLITNLLNTLLGLLGGLVGGI
jgi:hypothetical protein